MKNISIMIKILKVVVESKLKENVNKYFSVVVWRVMSRPRSVEDFTVF